MQNTRRLVVLTGVALLSSCGSNAGTNVVPLLPAAPMAQTLSVEKETGAAVLAPAPAATTLAAGEIAAGAGFSDVSPHQLVRTSGNLLYVAVPECISYPTCYGNALKMMAGNRTGNPTAFVEEDAAHHPQTSAAAKDAIGSSAMAINGSGVIYVAYNTRNEGTYVISFNTATKLWSKAERLGTTSAGGSYVSQGREGVAMAVDESGVPHVVFSFLGAGNVKHIAAAQLSGSSWTTALQVDDAKLGTGQGALHPTIAYTPKNRLLVAWLAGNETAAYNTPDGTIHVRDITELASSPASVVINDTNNAQGHPGYAATTIDQGPSLLVTADGVAHLTYIDTDDVIRYWFSDASSDYGFWNGWHQPARQQTHDPSLGPDGSGGVYIYGHGTPAGNQNGHGNNLYRMHLAAGSETWTGFSEVVADTNTDCSVSTRWSQFFHYAPSQVDYTYWDDHYPNLEYVSDQ